jgi:hypothetical protein
VAQSQQEQQPTLVVQGGDSGGEGEDTQQGAPAAQNTMQGQQPFKPQGLPSSRSDTMLLKSASGGNKLGALGGGGGSANGLARGGGGDVAAAGTAAAAAGPGQQPPSGLQSNTSSVPVYVMLPLDTVNAEGVFRYASTKWFSVALQRLAATGIRGVAVDVWVSDVGAGLLLACMAMKGLITQGRRLH